MLELNNSQNANMTTQQYIILDTNIWVYDTKLLSDPISASLLFYLNKTEGKLIVPEVIEKEVASNITKVTSEACKQITKQYLLLQKMFGSVDEYILPNETSAQQLFKNKLKQISNLIIRQPFKLSHAKGALDRIIAGIPPNKPSTQKKQGDQQFKDSCIWEVATEFSKKGEVVFITRDYGFYEGNNPEKGLAKPLKKELENLRNNIAIFPSIHSFLKDIKDSIPKLEPRIIRRVLYQDMQENQTLLNAVDNDQIGQITSISFKAFLTEKVNTVAIHYKLGFDIDNVEDIDTEDPLGEGVMIVKGTCLFDYTSEIINQNSIDEISFEDQNGFPLPGKGTTIFSRISATIGRGTIRHQFKSKMPHEML